LFRFPNSKALHEENTNRTQNDSLIDRPEISSLIAVSSNVFGIPVAPYYLHNG
jgi:hypothetical protein